MCCFAAIENLDVPTFGVPCVVLATVSRDVELQKGTQRRATNTIEGMGEIPYMERLERQFPQN